MAKAHRDAVVVGCGIAGLSAALSAAQRGAKVAVLERAPREDRGGQTRWTEAYLRMKSEHEVADDFETHLAENAGATFDPTLVAAMTGAREHWPPIVKSLALPDPEMIARFAAEAGPTIQWLKRAGVRFDFLPTQFLTKTQPRLLPVGGGLALIEALAPACEAAGVEFFYETTARSLLREDDGTIAGVAATDRDGRSAPFAAPSVVLGCGGFEGNAEMMTRYLGPRARFLRPISRGGYFNKGEGIRMALDIGAAPCGDFGSYHAEPIDPRSGAAEPSIMIFPYGILVNREARRFTDEAPGAIDAHYESVTRRIYEQSDGIAYVILDARLADVPNHRLAIRTDQPAITGASVEELARNLKMDAGQLAATIADYNAGCRPGTFKPLEVDELSTQGVIPAKSNWARPLDRPPFQAYPIISANVFTFGGLKIDERARVLDLDGHPIRGLYAAGELVGTYYGTYTGATSVLKGAVFGRLAGLDLPLAS
jgi:tricarballylate dehydrogenase